MEDKNIYCLLDYETYSEADLGDCGGWEYSVHPSTEIMCVAWRSGARAELRDAPVKYWHPGLGTEPLSLVKLLADRRVIKVAQNAYFEQVITRNVLTRYVKNIFTRELLRTISPAEWICTAATGAPLALPRKLELLCKVLRLPHQKNMDGNKVMKKLSRPRKPSKNNPSTRHRDPDDFRKLIRYCIDDIKAETELFLWLPPLPPMERALWELDQKVNLRGVRLDRPAIETILKMVDVELVQLTKRTVALTNGEVESTSKLKQVHAWLKKQDVHLPNLQAKTIEDAIDEKLVSGKALELLEIRQAAGLASIAKYRAFEQRTRHDGSLRDFRVYHGASTGRDTGSGAQMHNLIRQTMKQSDIEEVLNLLVRMST